MKIHKFEESTKPYDEFQEFGKNIVNVFELKTSKYHYVECFFHNKKIYLIISYNNISMEEIDKIKTLMDHINSFNNDIKLSIHPKNKELMELYLILDMTTYIKISDDINTKVDSKKYNL